MHDDLPESTEACERIARSDWRHTLLGSEHINAEEELVSRMWLHVYGLRAELIATLRLGQAEVFEAQTADHRQAALREQSDLRQLIAEYTETYGEQLIQHGEAEFTVEALARLSGWRL